VLVKDKNTIAWHPHGEVAFKKCAIQKTYSSKPISNSIVGLPRINSSIFMISKSNGFFGKREVFSLHFVIL
jgi:hypothetical protein